MVKLLVFFLVLFLFVSGCIENSVDTEENNKDTLEIITSDYPSVLPDWKDEIYHDYGATKKMLNDFHQQYPQLTDVFTIGKSVLEREIYAIKITNKINSSDKYACLIDGCIHGNEWESAEACLYLAEYLLMNFDANKSVSNILNSSIIYLVPMVNPDGREADTRWNENGIDLNRNFDVHFGRLRSGNFPLGKFFGVFKIPIIKHPFRKNILLGKTSTNCGRKPFSEPETKALSDFMGSIDDFSFYINCHTAMHAITSVVDVDYKPEFTVTNQEKQVIDITLDGLEEISEYGIVHVDDVSFSGAGFAHHWCFKKFHIPSFCFELLSFDYDPMFGHGVHEDLSYWMKTTLPVFLYLLVNIEDLNQWQMPSKYPLLPEELSNE